MGSCGQRGTVLAAAGFGVTGCLWAALSYSSSQPLSVDDLELLETSPATDPLLVGAAHFDSPASLEEEFSKDDAAELGGEAGIGGAGAHGSRGVDDERAIHGLAGFNASWARGFEPAAAADNFDATAAAQADAAAVAEGSRGNGSLRVAARLRTFPPEEVENAELDASSWRRRRSRPPTVAFFILGYRSSLRPVWTMQDDMVLLFAPPSVCANCSADVKPIKKASKKYITAPQGWWCAQRTYMVGLRQVVTKYPRADWYFLADVDTVVFRDSLQSLMKFLDDEVLEPTEHLFVGHGYDLTSSHITRIIMSGGGVLVRGLTLRRLETTGEFDWCAREQLFGKWCFHHLDWVLAECMNRIHVPARGHAAFQQNTCHMHEDVGQVACHPAKRRKLQRKMIAAHEVRFSSSKDALKPSWAKPCTEYSWRSDLQSKCKAVSWGFDKITGGSLTPMPTVAFLVWGNEESELPLWASQDDDLVMYFPPQTCSECPESAVQNKKADGTSAENPQSWWCAQRHYLNGVQQLLTHFPKKDFYFLADVDTTVFRDSLSALLQLLEFEVLATAEDLYMGHGYDLSECKLLPTILAGGGILLRGHTLRKLASSGELAVCIKDHVEGQWCWHHADWAIAECLQRINVTARGHGGFQQHSCTFYQRAETVACHPAPSRETQRVMLERHALNFTKFRRTLNSTWATPCDAEDYYWRSPSISKCRRKPPIPPAKLAP